MGPLTGKNKSIFFVIAFAVAASSFSFYIYQVLYSPNIFVGKENGGYIEIPDSAGFRDVQNILSEKKIVNDLMAFSFLAKVMKYDKHVKPGRYRLTEDMNNITTIRLLRSGQQTPVALTFNNIRLLDELPGKICDNLEMDSTELLAYLDSPAVYEKYGFNRYNFIDMFIPNTYEIYWTISPEQFVERMKKEYDNFWNEERTEKCNEIGFTPKEVDVLASIVKAECFHKEEAPVIAGLYINRIRKNMPLQADPTVVFANKDFSIRRVLNKHINIDSPYNTYKYTGLPPGPINMPDILYVEAVLNYTHSDYLYMCAKADFSDYHNFTSSYAQHLKNAREYARELNKEKIYK